MINFEKIQSKNLITDVTSWFYIDDESFRREDIAKMGLKLVLRSIWKGIL